MREIVDKIRYWHRQRCFAMEQRKRIDLALGSFLRLMLGWSKDKPEAERKRIANQAAALIRDGDSDDWGDVIAASIAARAPFDKIELRCVKEISALAASLPVWSSFGESIRGFGAASLGVIVAEAGLVSCDPHLPAEDGNYPSVAKLWKRLGLAVLDGVRQGGLAKGASKDDWIAHGYSPQRRSRVWNIGDALIKGNRDGVYRSIYLNRKTYELARDPEMTPMKAHRRAQRYMEKCLLRDLWKAWRRTMIVVHPVSVVSAATSSEQSERSAVNGFSPVDRLPSESIPAKPGKRRAKLQLNSIAQLRGASIERGEP